MTNPHLPIIMHVNCLGKRHQIIINARRKLVLTHHDDLTIERALQAFGGPEPRCLEILRAWKRLFGPETTIDIYYTRGAKHIIQEQKAVIPRKAHRYLESRLMLKLNRTARHRRHMNPAYRDRIEDRAAYQLTSFLYRITDAVSMLGHPSASIVTAFLEILAHQFPSKAASDRLVRWSIIYRQGFALVDEHLILRVVRRYSRDRMTVVAMCSVVEHCHATVWRASAKEPWRLTWLIEHKPHRSYLKAKGDES